MVPRREGEEAESAVAADANNASGEAVESFVRPSSHFLYVCILIATVDSKLFVSLKGRSHTQIGCDLLETLLRKLELIEIFRMSIHLRRISPRICGKRALSDLVISLEFFVQRGRTIVRFAISLVAQRRHRLRNSSLCSLLWYERLHGLHVGPTRFPASK